jgi:hypothetical protein
MISKGSTIAYFDIQTLYDGVYLVRLNNGTHSTTKKIVVER